MPTFPRVKPSPFLTRRKALSPRTFPELIPLPDIRQRNHWECGAAAAASVGGFFGVGPSKLEDWAEVLGTSLEHSTHPHAIRDYLRSLGLQVEDREGLTVEDLKDYHARGMPVIVPLQDYGERREEGADFKYGHYLVVVGCGMGMVFCQDPSADNVVAGGDAKPISTTGSIQAPGRVMIEEAVFDKVWHDKDVNGNKFDHYGIAVGPPNPLPSADSIRPFSGLPAADTIRPKSLRTDSPVKNVPSPIQTSPNAAQAKIDALPGMPSANSIRFFKSCPVCGGGVKQIQGGWRCEDVPCEWSIYGAGGDSHMERRPNPVIHDQEPFERERHTREVDSRGKALSVEEQLAKLAEEAYKKKTEDEDGSPDYGYMAYNPESGEAWYTLWDGDGREFERWLKAEMGKIVGKDKVKMEAEVSPKEEEGWVRLFPKRNKGKAMSWLGSGSGGDLVPPPEQGRRIKLNRPRVKASRLWQYRVKGGTHEGEPCKRGWSPRTTGCKPKGKPTGKNPGEKPTGATPLEGSALDSPPAPKDNKPPPSRISPKPSKTTKPAKPRKASIEDATTKITEVLEGEATPEKVKEVADLLSSMTMVEIGKLKKQLGVKASGLKADMVKKVTALALKRKPKAVDPAEIDAYASVSDAALDSAYHYGLAKPGSFGHAANQSSAKAALTLIKKGDENLENISAAIHEGWAETARTFDDPAYQTKPEKKANRLKLAKTPYEKLPEEEKEKDRVAARAILKEYHKQEWKKKGEKLWRPGPNPTSTVAVTRDGPNGKEVLMVKRKEGTVEGGKWALPGGFVETDAGQGEPWTPGKENPDDAAIRELAEETGLNAAAIKEHLKKVDVRDKPGRDPRDSKLANVVDNGFALHLPPELAEQMVQGADDASEAKWVPVSEVDPETIAFDHAEILDKANVVPKPPEPGFTGTDALGREWVDGELVAAEEEKPTEEEHGEEEIGEGDHGTGGGGIDKPTQGVGGPVAEEVGGSLDANDDQSGNRQGGSPSGETTGDVPSPEEQARLEGLKEAFKRIDRFKDFYEKKALRESDPDKKEDQLLTARLLDSLRAHIEKVGVDAALEGLAAPRGTGKGKPSLVQYAEADVTDLAKEYLKDNGIILVSEFDRKSAGVPIITPGAESYTSQAPRKRPVRGDFTPTESGFANKLVESQHLPGLESSEDLGKIMGKPVTHLTQDVIQKLDERYGKGRWVVKPYGAEAAQSHGIFFPQYASKIQQQSRQAIFAAEEAIKKFKFELVRSPDGKLTGLRTQKTGEEYGFGTDEYLSHVPDLVRKWGDLALMGANSENGAELPEEGRQFMAQPAFEVVGVSEAEREAGQTISPGEGRVHIVTRNGKAEFVPYATRIKTQELPVVFEDENTRAMMQAALDVINQLPESERQGQIYAPDVIKTTTGWKIVEVNPSNDTGFSGWLSWSPYAIDALVSHLTSRGDPKDARDPLHVQFIRKLLRSAKKRDPKKSLNIFRRKSIFSRREWV